MLFNSFEFLIFFPVVTVLFFLLPHSLRWLLLLLASCIFYCYYIPVYLLLLIFIIIVDYFAALKMEKLRHRKIWLALSITANIGILLFFKYASFFIANINAVSGEHFSGWNIILPIGLSFHTFQALSYTIEVYRGNVKAEKHIGIYALYVLFYPQLVAGPIERPQNILPQLWERKKFSAENMVDGLRLMLWGFFKKLVIADRAAIYVDIVYKNPFEYHWLNVMIAIFLFSIQLYCDFSGYSDIARGAAKVMGYDLMINFNRPFSANNLREFWSRWHISLSTWFRDYVYIPMGGNRVTKPKRVLALLTIFLLSGLWHGAGWNFILWGLLHALFIVILLYLPSVEIRFKALSILFTNFIVAYTFVFFRNSSVNHAKEIILHSFDFSAGIPFVFEMQSHHGQPGIGNISMLMLLSFIIFLFYYEYKTTPDLQNSYRRTIWDVCWFVFVLLSIIFMGVFTKQSFIYFQF